jgi:uncharacterized membrane-anchored protein YitT (DUF2179 family)
MQSRDIAFSHGRPHSVAEDAYALMIGCILIVVGLIFLKAAGLVTGGVAGIALLISYKVPLPAGVLFTLINIPFFAFAHKVMGARFAVKSLLVNIGIASFSALARASIRVVDIHPAFAALVGGTGVLTLWLQRTRGWNAGRSQIAIDVVILAISAPVLTATQLAWSALSAAAMSLILIAWHRPGRYIGH